MHLSLIMLLIFNSREISRMHHPSRDFAQYLCQVARVCNFFQCLFSGACGLLCTLFCQLSLSFEMDVQLVLGSARTGLIFTRSREGTQPSGLTQTGQPNGYSIPRAVVLGSEWGSWPGEKLIAAWELMGHRAVRVALCILLLILHILLISIIVVAVRFLCCSVKLPLYQPTSFRLLLSILLPIPVGGGATERSHGPFVAGQG